jgi:hypothetical protein
MSETEIAFRIERAERQEFACLNHELVQKTQILLGAVAGGHQHTSADFEASLDNLGCDAAERATIETIFRRHALIEFDGSEVRATDKGRRYAKSDDRQVRAVDLDREPSATQGLFPFRPMPIAYWTWPRFRTCRWPSAASGMTAAAA